MVEADIIEGSFLSTWKVDFIWTGSIQVSSATFDKHTGRAVTAKRLRLKAQGCFNLGLVSSDHHQPGTGCAKGRNRVAVESVIQFCHPR